MDKDNVRFEYCWPISVDAESSKPEVRAGIAEMNAWWLEMYLQEHPEMARRAAHA